MRLPTIADSWRSRLPDRTNLSSTRGAASETPVLPGDPVAQLALVALELDFCFLGRLVHKPRRASICCGQLTGGGPAR